MSTAVPVLLPHISLQERLKTLDLKPATIARLTDVFDQTVVADPRRVFREPGRLRNEIIFVRSGLLGKFKVNSLGNRQTVALRFPGDAILPQVRTAEYGVRPMVRSVLDIGNAEEFKTVLDVSVDLQYALRRSMERQLAISYQWLLNFGGSDATARVAHLLCETAVRSGADLRRVVLVNPFTQQQISEITGQSAINVNRVFADLEKLGLIRRIGREIQFKDWEELSRLAGFNADYLQ